MLEKISCFLSSKLRHSALFVFQRKYISTSLITSFSRKHAEAIIPETTRNQESTIHCSDEAVTPYLQLLTEIVTQMTTQRGIRTIRCLSYEIYCRNFSITLSTEYFLLFFVILTQNRIHRQWLISSLCLWSICVTWRLHRCYKLFCMLINF